MSVATEKVFRDAVTAFNARKFPDADRLFRIFLTSQPKHVGALNLLTVTLMSMERFAEAEQYITRALKLDSASDASFRNYGIILKRLGKPSQALVQLDRALELNSSQPETWNSRGAVLNDLQEYERALSDFDRAISLDRNYYGALYNKGKSLGELKQYDEAFTLLDKALTIKPDLAEAWLARGDLSVALEKYDDALGAYGKASALKPDLAEAWNGRGNVLYELKDRDGALAAYDRALRIKPDLAGAWVGRGNIFTEGQRYDEALTAYDEALVLKPDLIEPCLGRGAVLTELGRYDEAFAAYDRAFAIKPDLAKAWVGRGRAFFELNRDVEALSCYDRAIFFDGNLAESHFDKSLVKLSLGEFREGWELYEWRWKTRMFPSPNRNFSQPHWLGDSKLDGKTILIHAEQGFGDTIQFFRYVLRLTAEAHKVIFEVPNELVPLFEDQKARLALVTRGDVLPNFDVHCPLMSLPRGLRTTLQTIPASIPYLRAPVNKVGAWHKALGAKTKPRIGLAWSGNPNLRNDLRRSIRLEQLLPFLTEAAEWHSLQKDIRDHDRECLTRQPAIADHSAQLRDFSDTAGLIAELDLVICVDTAVAHLAGALGKPVWVLLPFHPDFRWLRERRDSPWYPTAKLFRQTKSGVWGDVVGEISKELRTFLAADGHASGS